MSKSCACWLVLGCLGLLAAARADELVKFPTGDAAWTVDVTYTAAPAGTPIPTPRPGASPAVVATEANKPKKIEVTQIRGVAKVHITWLHGPPTERWALPTLSIVLEDDPRNDSVFPVKSGSRGEKITEFDLAYGPPAFTWLDPKDLVGDGPINYLGKKCFHYEGSVLSPAMMGPSKPLKRMAWIDSATLLPVALGTDTSLSVFTFGSSPSGPLVLPPKFQAELDRYKAIMGFP
jgi:hypothetical protein